MHHRHRSPRFRRTPRRLFAVLTAALLLAGCGGPDTAPIPEVRERPARRPPAPLDQDAATRLGLGQDPHAGIPGFGGATGGGMGMAHGAPAGRFAFETPQGWRPLPPGPGREAGFTVGPEGAARVTLSLAGGSLLANVNRWRRQMDRDPLAASDLEALPTRQVLGESAVLVEIEGTYTSMRGTTIPDAKMLGIVVPRTGQSVFVKMVGPTATVEAEREAFEAFARSVRRAEEASAHAGHPPLPDGPHPAAPPPPATLSWDKPDGWVEAPSAPPRAATFQPEGAKEAECLVTVLRGSGGGVAANMNEWRRQMGQPELTPQEYADLKRLSVLGVDAVYITVRGHYRGKSGEDETDALLHGLIAPREHDTVFVKMWGPTNEVQGQEERFLAFCRSLRE